MQSSWFLIDAQDKILGRLASQIARIIQGKHKPDYAPNLNCGDFVVVINAAKVRVTGRKEKEKIYRRYTGYSGGLKEESLAELRKRDPTQIIHRAVKGMLPKNRLANKMMKKFFVYAEDKYPHQAQKPRKIKLGDV